MMWTSRWLFLPNQTRKRCVVLPVLLRAWYSFGTQDDPIIEYEDEFGRLRTSRRSEVPRHLLHKSQDEEEEIDDA